ncbi:MAG TPA: hypothetical protein VMS84_07915 [Mycobacterium sp.]|jgi:hypothetical protein|nr:hypothetical protein [Mycobacterium sp.]
MSEAQMVRAEWDVTRLLLENHQHAGRQLSGNCTCGFAGEYLPAYLDHLTDVLMGVQID